MRNLSTVTLAARSFTTINCNDEYFRGDPSEVLSDALKAVDHAFENRRPTVAKVFSDLIRQNINSEEDIKSSDWGDAGSILSLCTWSELRVLLDLRQIYLQALVAWDSYFDFKGACTFTYVNCNTGVSVSWHVVTM